MESFKEPLLSSSNSRLSFYPIVHRDARKLYKTALDCIWNPNDINLMHDVRDWNELLTDNEQTFIKFVLSYCITVDGVINENVPFWFGSEVQHFELKHFWSLQVVVENVHSEMYARFIDVVITENTKLSAIFTSASFALASFNESLMNLFSQVSFCDHIVTFACMQCITFSSISCAISFLTKNKFMPGLTMFNELITRDRNLRTKFVCLIHNKYLERPSTRVQEIVMHVVEIVCVFVKESMQLHLIDMNTDEMCVYLKFCGDTLLVDLGCQKVYNVDNPFNLVERIVLTDVNTLSKSKIIMKRVRFSDE